MLSGSGTDFPLECFFLAVPGRSNYQVNFNNILTEPADGFLPVLLHMGSKRYAAFLLYLAADWPVVPHTWSGRLRFQWILFGHQQCGHRQHVSSWRTFHTALWMRNRQKFLGLGTIQGQSYAVIRRNTYFIEIFNLKFDYNFLNDRGAGGHSGRSCGWVLFDFAGWPPFFFWFMGTHHLLGSTSGSFIFRWPLVSQVLHW